MQAVRIRSLAPQPSVSSDLLQSPQPHHSHTQLQPASSRSPKQAPVQTVTSAVLTSPPSTTRFLQLHSLVATVSATTLQLVSSPTPTDPRSLLVQTSPLQLQPPPLQSTPPVSSLLLQRLLRPSSHMLHQLHLRFPAPAS